MRLATVIHAGATSAARVEGDEVVLLPEPDLGALLARTDWRDHAATADGRTALREDVRFAATIPSPRKILCAGLNYRSHIAETGRPAPTHPFFFPKFDNSLIGAYDDIPLPAISDTVDWEAELTIVIGSPARRVVRGRSAPPCRRLHGDERRQRPRVAETRADLDGGQGVRGDDPASARCC